MTAIQSGRVLGLACAAMVAACAEPADFNIGSSGRELVSGVHRAAGGACAAGAGQNANNNDCLTVDKTWGAVGARPVNEDNGNNHPVYTGIDQQQDNGLIALETAYANGFGSAGGRATGAVYGAHGEPGWIQGLPDNAGAQGAGTILRAAFGNAGIPFLALSVCFDGNTGADTSANLLGSNPRTFKNNLSAAAFIKDYFGIASAVIVGCKNGVVRPSQETMWCTQWKYLKDGWKVEDVLGDATVIQGDGTARGTATTPAVGAAEDSGDAEFVVQAAAGAAPKRAYTARNLPRRRLRRQAAEAAPWNLAFRCSCPSGICNVRDNYPRFTTQPPFAQLGQTTGFDLDGRFLTTQIVIEQPDGSIVSVSGASADEYGLYASFDFTPSQVGVHHVWMTDGSNLQNDPWDPDYPLEQFVVSDIPYPDAGMPGQDAGVPGQDAGMPGQDAGMPGQDAGMPGQDAGMPGFDAGGPGPGLDAGGPGPSPGRDAGIFRMP